MQTLTYVLTQLGKPEGATAAALQIALTKLGFETTLDMVESVVESASDATLLQWVEENRALLTKPPSLLQNLVEMAAAHKAPPEGTTPLTLQHALAKQAIQFDRRTVERALAAAKAAQSNGAEKQWIESHWAALTSSRQYGLNLQRVVLEHGLPEGSTSSTLHVALIQAKIPIGINAVDGASSIDLAKRKPTPAVMEWAEKHQAELKSFGSLRRPDCARVLMTLQAPVDTTIATLQVALFKKVGIFVGASKVRWALDDARARLDVDLMRPKTQWPLRNNSNPTQDLQQVAAEYKLPLGATRAMPWAALDQGSQSGIGFSAVKEALAAQPGSRHKDGFLQPLLRPPQKRTAAQASPAVAGPFVRPPHTPVDRDGSARGPGRGSTAEPASEAPRKKALPPWLDAIRHSNVAQPRPGESEYGRIKRVRRVYPGLSDGDVARAIGVPPENVTRALSSGHIAKAAPSLSSASTVPLARPVAHMPRAPTDPLQVELLRQFNLSAIPGLSAAHSGSDHDSAARHEAARHEVAKRLAQACREQGLVTVTRVAAWEGRIEAVLAWDDKDRSRIAAVVRRPPTEANVPTDPPMASTPEMLTHLQAELSLELGLSTIEGISAGYSDRGYDLKPREELAARLAQACQKQGLAAITNVESMRTDAVLAWDENDPRQRLAAVRWEPPS
jgi:hypothetical protein